MRYYSIKGAAMRKMEENMGIFKDDDEKTTENVSLPEDLNLDDIGDDLGSLFDEDKTDDADIADDNVDKDLLSQIFRMVRMFQRVMIRPLMEKWMKI